MAMDVDTPLADPNSPQALRARLHKQNDTLQKHEGRLTEHEVRVKTLERQVDALATQTATREQLDNAVLALGTKVTTAVELMTVKITGIANDITTIKTEDIRPIKNGIYWVVGLVFSAVIIGALSFLIRRPGG